MSELFLHIFNTGLSASWLILAVLAVRMTLKKAPRSLICGLWAIVGVYLLCPISIEAPFSLVPSTEIISPESMYAAAPEITSGVAIIDNAMNPGFTEAFRTDGLASVNPLQIWAAVCANLWLLGVLFMVGWAVFSWLRIRRQTAEAIHSCENIWLCDRIGTPFILGLLRPRIYLPSGLEGSVAAHVIAHEKAHLARRDHWWKPLGYLLLSMFWFQPLLWVSYSLLCRDIELACDERVIRDMSMEEKKGYSSALLRCSVPRRMIAACPLAFGEVGIKARIKSVLNYRKPGFWLVMIAVVLVIVLAACFLTSPVAYTPEIRYNGVLYIQDGPSTGILPDKIQSEGTLESILHRTNDHPEENNQATNLDWEYAGCKFYTVGSMLYLEQPGGGSYLPFRTDEEPAEQLPEQTVPEETVPEETEEALLDTDGCNPLGIHVTVENVRPSGLTLVCTQDGTLWNQIYTGSPYFIERWENGEWIPIAFPEDTAWTMEAIGVPIGEESRFFCSWEWALGELPQGHYRIGKSFSGERYPFGNPLNAQTAEQTCYAEFDIA